MTEFHAYTDKDWTKMFNEAKPGDVIFHHDVLNDVEYRAVKQSNKVARMKLAKRLWTFKTRLAGEFVWSFIGMVLLLYLWDESEWLMLVVWAGLMTANSISIYTNFRSHAEDLKLVEQYKNERL